MMSPSDNYFIDYFREPSPLSCTLCHGQPPDGNTSPNLAGSHETHISGTNGPGISDCSVCHADPENPTHLNTFTSFSSGVDINSNGNIELAETDICDNCHSPAGSYDGVNDPDIGAKTNWQNGVYTGSDLTAGKEKWCAGCHDESPANSMADGSGIYAPGVIGDENASTVYGTGYGFYKTGHGLPSEEAYPASSGTVPGSGLSCNACHDFSMNHIDGNERTYESPGTPEDYQNGYRLISVDGEVPLVIPRWNECADDGVDANDFRLCLSCHDSEPFVNSSSSATNFRTDDGMDFANSHYNHLSIKAVCGPGPAFQSDWGPTIDSRVSCVECHNVHGSSQLSMVRDGKLVDREPGIQVLYHNSSVTYDCFIYPSPSDVSLPNSTGTIWNGNLTTGFCGSACHGGCGFNNRYDRVPFDLTPPEIISVYGQIGNNTLIVNFSEGVYSDLGAFNNLTPGDFSLTDTDNNRTITNVVHTVGDAYATLILSSALDATNDLGIDELSAASAGSIYDAASNPMNTTSITINGNNPPDTPSNTSPTDGGIDQSTTPTLSSSNFADQDAGDTHQASQWQITTTPGDYSSPVYDSGTTSDLTSHTTGTSLNGSTTYYWHVRHLDNNGALSEWSDYSTETSFTTGSGPQSIILHPSGLSIETGGWSTVPTDAWETALDSNDGDGSYAVLCCTSPNWSFYVDMDDPGLGDVTIQSITIYVYARYATHPTGGTASGDVNIGYRTGTNTVWNGNTNISSADHSLIVSGAYTTDSDGGALDFTDITNLEIVVRRIVAGSNQLRVTEVYVNVTYLP